MRVTAITNRVPTRHRIALLGALLAAVALALPVPAASAAAGLPASGTAATTPVVVPAGLTGTAADYSSIFADNDPALDGAGWASCSSAITWDVDLGTLDAAAGQRAIADLQWAFEQWSQASGLTFSFAGPAALTYDDATFTLARADGQPNPARHIDIAFVDDSATTRMGGQTVGLGSPAQVVPTTKEIVSGVAIFRTDHAAVAGPDEARSLYLHELGHVLGLAHAHDAANVMYPLVSNHVDLGPGDVHGVQALDKPCSATA